MNHCLRIKALFTRSVSLAAATLLASTAAVAGRPLNVDDANVNDKGKGHIEAWTTRADGLSLYSLSPAFAPFNGVEFGGLFSKETESRLKAMALQVKWRITPSQENGCNLAAIGGLSRATAAGFSANGSYVTALVSCNGLAGGSMHVNLGLSKANGSGNDAVGSWGLAYERTFGAITPHIEYYGTEGGKPTVAVGVRGMITDKVQLDGSVGRNEGITIYSLGAKLVF